MPHGECNAILLTGVVAFNYAACPERYDRIAEIMGLDLSGLTASARAELLVEKIASLREQVGILPTVGRLGVKKNDIPRLAEFAMQDACMATNPAAMNKREIEMIYEAVL